ncbi:MAG: hypothetical protein BMS9Abin29_2637 [Gemmatimonadota bacterium]|nr:MAG: hypothetical protein BMS9Abin29_2637 [Gemmatimonadota bacterium]
MSHFRLRLPFGCCHFLSALLVLVLASCGGDDGGTEPVGAEPGSLTFIGVPTEGTAGQTLPVTVEVRDTGGQPFSGASIAITGQGGIQVAAAQVVTGPDGRGSTTATLPEATGTGGLTAALSSLTATASILVSADAPTTIAVVSGNNQTAAPGATLPDPIVVQVTDQFNNPVAGTTVTFQGTGGASVSSSSVDTDSEGRASVQVTLGPQLGTHGVVASHADAGEIAFEFQTTTPVTRVDAMEAVRTLVIEPESQGCLVLGLAMPSPLPAGTVVREFASAVDEPDQLVLASASWFVFVDLVPAYRWDHPVLYVVVDVVTGEMTVEKAFGPPVIDGELHYLSLTERLQSADRFSPMSAAGLFEKSCVREVTFAGSPGAQASGSAAPQEPGGGNINVFTGSELGELLRLRSAAGRIVGVVINGGEPETDAAGNPVPGASNWDRDAQQMQQTLEMAGAEVTAFNFRDHSLLDAINGARAAAQGLGPDDKFVLYFVGHGILNDRDNDDMPDGGKNESLLYGAGTANEGVWDITSTDNEFGLLGLLDDIPAGTVNLVVDACFAGSIPLWMSSPASGDPFQPGLPGASLNVFVASSALKSAAGSRRDDSSWDPHRDNPQFEALIPGTYTERFLDGLAAQELDADGNGEVSVLELETAWMAEHATLVTALDQMPPATSTFTAPPLIEVTPTTVSFSHFVGSTPCPQSIGSVTLKNPSNLTVEWSASSGNGAINASPPTGTLAPGAEVTVSLLFNCSIAQSFTTPVTFQGAVAGSSLSSDVTVAVTATIM